MQVYRITQGNTLPELRIVCAEQVDTGDTGVVIDPTPVDLTGATCVLVAASPTDVMTTFPMTILDAPNGVVHKFFTAAESQAFTVGQWSLFVRVTFASGDVETFPDLERGLAMFVLEKR